MAPPIEHPCIKFNHWDTAEYRGFTIERVEKGRNRQGHKQAYWMFRILGRKGWYTELDLVVEEIDYLKARAIKPPPCYVT